MKATRRKQRVQICNKKKGVMLAAETVVAADARLEAYGGIADPKKMVDAVFWWSPIK